MPTEYLLALGLVVVAVITTAISAVSTQRALRSHTKLLKTQAQVINAAKRRIQAEIHKEASEDFERLVADVTARIKEDLRHTGESLSAYVRTEMQGALRNELEAFEQSSKEIGKVSSDALQHLQDAVNQEQAKVIDALSREQQAVLDDLRTQHQQLTGSIEKVVQEEIGRRLQRFESELTQITSAYINDALGSQLAMEDQMAYVLAEMDRQKAQIVEDVRNAA